jgi:hypothetical protein
MSDLQTWRDKISEDVGETKAGMMALNRNIDLLRGELFGNGQPGAIGKLFELHRAAEARISAMERWQSRALGIWAGASAVVSGAVTGTVLYFSRKGN